MIGGATRTPRVQELLKEFIGDLELSSHLNGDEAMAKGAAFHAANFSASFRVRPVKLSDGLNVPVQLHIETLEGGEEIRSVELFGIK